MSSPSPARLTRQQTAVAEHISHLEDFTSAQGIHVGMRTSGASIGLATVYRALQALEERGDVDVLRTDEGEALYRACSTSHHHHLLCTSCGTTIEIEASSVERWIDGIAAEHGFTHENHTLEIFGLCPACRAGGAGAGN